MIKVINEGKESQFSKLQSLLRRDDDRVKYWSWDKTFDDGSPYKRFLRFRNFDSKGSPTDGCLIDVYDDRVVWENSAGSKQYVSYITEEERSELLKYLSSKTKK